MRAFEVAAADSPAHRGGASNLVSGLVGRPNDGGRGSTGRSPSRSRSEHLPGRIAHRARRPQASSGRRPSRLIVRRRILRLYGRSVTSRSHVLAVQTAAAPSCPAVARRRPPRRKTGALPAELTPRIRMVEPKAALTDLPVISLPSFFLASLLAIDWLTSDYVDLLASFEIFNRS
jgi:hypothetical protein